MRARIATCLIGSRMGTGDGARWGLQLRCGAQHARAQEEGDDKETTEVQVRHNTGCPLKNG